MKQTTMADIEKEEQEFAHQTIENRFPEPISQTSGYESIKVRLIYKPDYSSFIEAAYIIGLTTWDQTGDSVICNCQNISFDEKEQIVKGLLKSRPISAIIELPMFAIQLIGCPRSMTHQIVRHRYMSFSQQSFRVSSCYPDPVRIPSNLTEAMKIRYAKHIKDGRDLYKQMIEHNIPMEQARNIMPMGTETKIVMVSNLKVLKDYMKARTSAMSQDEHTHIVNLIAAMLEKECPEFHEFIR